MHEETEALESAIAKVQGAAQSAVALVLANAKYIREHVGDPTKLKAYADSLEATAKDLGDAVVANPLPEE